VGPMQAVMSGVITIFFYAMVIAAVWKLFLIASDLSEIKTLLTDIRKNTAAPAVVHAVPAASAVASATAAPGAVFTPAPPVPPVLSQPMSLESAEALLREIAAEEPKTTA
jgi:hypothetical protein